MSGRAIPRQVVLSWSGGKDSSLTLERMRSDPATDVVALLTCVTRGYDRVSIHGVRRTLLHAQARALGLPLFEATLEPASGNAEYEAAFAAGVAAVRRAHPAVDAIAFGDLFLEDVRAYRERLVAPLGVEPLFPLWGSDTAALATAFAGAPWEAHLVCVDTTQLAADFAGRTFREALPELPPSVDPCGERGEFHTFVSAGPIFAEPLRVRVGDCVLRDGRFMFADLEAAESAGR